MAGSTATLSAFARELERYRDDPDGFCEKILEFTPHEGQRNWLAHSTRAENALTTGNRYGKSHIAAAKRIYKCAFTKGWSRKTFDERRRLKLGYRSINIAITSDQSRIVWLKAMAMLQLPKISWFVREIKMTPFPTIVFQNGATIEARSTTRDGMYLLGHDFDDVNWDEAAREKRFTKVLDDVIRMRLVDRAGSLDITSTGAGRNEYGRYFLNGLEGKDANLYAQTGSTYENPNIPKDRVDLAASRMSGKMRQQNIDGAIIDGGGDFFPVEDLQAAQHAELDAICRHEYDNEGMESHSWLQPGYVEGKSEGESWKAKYPSHLYVHGWDLADKKDWCVGTTWDLSTTPVTLVEFERFHKRGWEFNYDRIRRRHHKYGTKKATKLDITGLGDVVVSDLADIGAEGVNFSGGRKDELLTNLQTLLAFRTVRWPMIRVFVDEHQFYERDDEDLDTDCVMSAAVAGWWIKRMASVTRVTIATAKNRT